jgi:hypothetical protein
LFGQRDEWSGSITLKGNSQISSRANHGVTNTISGVIQEDGTPRNLTFEGVQKACILALTGTNTYSGDTYITGYAGFTVALQNDGATTFGSIAKTPLIDVGEGTILDVTGVAAGFVLGSDPTTPQTLRGNGTVNGDVVVASGSTVAAGSSLGQLDIAGAVDLGGTLDVEYDSSTDGIDLLTVSGRLDLSGGTLRFSDLAEEPVALDQVAYVFATYGSLAGSAPSLEEVPAGYHVDFAYEGNQIALVVPEPSTLILLALAGWIVTIFRQRR